MPLRASVLINNHDYERYVCEAVASALEQSRPADEVILVDDGSGDASLDRLKAAGLTDRIQVIAKENGGQLSAFHAGLAAASGDVVFFLDADDQYGPEYLGRMLDLYESTPECDFAYCSVEEFGEVNRIHHRHPESRDLGFSVLGTLHGREYVGYATTCVSARKALLDRFMPVPFEEDWRLRADDCVVWGSSIAGAHKFYVAEPLVRYRVHDRNGWFGREHSLDYRFRRRLRKARLFQHLLDTFGYRESLLMDGVLQEFESATTRTERELRVYQKIVRRSGRDDRWIRNRMRDLKRAYSKRALETPESKAKPRRWFR